MGEAAIKIEPGLCQFTVKKAGKKNLEIEGFANRFQVDGEEIVDRGGDTIMPDAWQLESFKKNPIIFFQHDRDFIVGKATDIRVEEDGLRIKVKISSSDHPDIAHIRTLIEEGILKSFSVGINIKDEEVDEMGVNRIKEAELLEVSLVSIPMNQESFFEISSKGWEATYKTSHFDDVLEEKGAWLAAAIHNRIFELAKNSESFDRSAILQQIAEQAESSSEELFEILAGNVTDVGEQFLDSFSRILDLNRDDLAELNEADIEVEGEILPDEAEEEEEEENQLPEEEGENEGNEEDPQTEEEEETSESASGEEEAGEETEEAQVDPENEESSENAEGREDDKPLDDPMLDDEEDDKDGKKQDVNTEEFKRCVSANIREAIDAGKDQDEALAFALEKCRRESGKCVLQPKDWSDIFTDIGEYKAQRLANLAAPLQDPDNKPLKEKKTKPKTKRPRVDKTEALGTVVASDVDQGNEFMAVAKQTNVLLSQVIGELQKLQQMMLDQSQRQEVQEQTEPTVNTQPPLPPGPPSIPANQLLSDNEIPKQLDIILGYKKKLTQKLATHGV